MQAGIFDFQGAYRIDENQNSKVNCMIGHTNIENGLMKPEALSIWQSIEFLH